MKEFRADAIVKQFVDKDNAIIHPEMPGQPIIVDGVDESQYFEVNSRSHLSCLALGSYKSKNA